MVDEKWGPEFSGNQWTNKKPLVKHKGFYKELQVRLLQFIHNCFESIGMVHC